MKLNANIIDTWLKNVPKSLQFFLIYGPELGQIKLIADKLVKHFGSQETDLNISNISFSKIKDDISLLTDEIASTSLFGGRKIIVLDDAPAALPKGMLELLKSPRGNAIVIFLSEELKPTSSLRKNFETLENCISIACYKDDSTTMQKYIREYLTQKNIEFSADIPSLLAESLPANRMLVNSEIEKLITYKEGDESPINSEDVVNVITEASEISLDELCNAIALKDPKLTQKCIEQLIQEDKNFVFVIRVLLKYFMRLFEIKASIEQGASVVDAVGKLRPPVFFKQKDTLIKNCRLVSNDRIKLVLNTLLKLELQCKNTFVSPELLTFNSLTHLTAA